MLIRAAFAPLQRAVRMPRMNPSAWLTASASNNNRNRLPKGFQEFDQSSNSGGNSNRQDKREEEPEEEEPDRPNNKDDKDKKQKNRKGHTSQSSQFLLQFNLTPANVLLYGFPAAFLIYSLANSNAENEITWHDFLVHYLENGLVDRLVWKSLVSPNNTPDRK